MCIRDSVCIELEGSTLVTGVNGSGKSTVLDAMTYLLTGNTQFNKAAKDRDRTVLGYVRGDTRSNGEARYLRNGSVVSYIAMEFSDPTLGVPLTVGVCIESPSEMCIRDSFSLSRLYSSSIASLSSMLTRHFSSYAFWHK